MASTSESDADVETRQILREELRRHRRKLLLLALGIVALVGGLIHLLAALGAVRSLGVVYLGVGGVLTGIGVMLLWLATGEAST